LAERTARAIRNERLTTKPPDEIGLFLAPRRAHDLMPGSDEPRQKASAYGAGGTG
jgi:hypothetical protein